jgi:hypothetical protein
MRISKILTVVGLENGVSTIKCCTIGRIQRKKMSREYLFSAIRVSGAHHYYYHLPI